MGDNYASESAQISTLPLGFRRQTVRMRLTCHVPPGARYAIVEDPDDNLVGLMGPIDPSRQYIPRPRS